MQYHAIPYNTMQYHALQCIINQLLAECTTALWAVKWPFYCISWFTQAMFDSPSTAEERRKIMLRSRLFGNRLKWNKSFNSNFSRSFIKIINLHLISRSDAHKIYNFTNFCAVCIDLCAHHSERSHCFWRYIHKKFSQTKKLLRIALHTESLKTESLFRAHFVGSLDFSTIVINYS